MPVHVYATGLSRRAATLNYLRCLFGNVSVSATLGVGSTEVECVAPRGKPGMAAVRVTNNLIDWSHSYLWFRFRMVRLTQVRISSSIHLYPCFHMPPISLNSVFHASPPQVLPDNGPVGGGTIISVVGNDLTASQRYGTWCRFHHGPHGATISVEAMFVSSSLVLCTTPSLPDGNAAVSSALSLQMGGRYTDDSLSFHFLVTITINSAHPMVGPTAGGTTIIVDGAHFTTGSYCRFNTRVVPAQYVGRSRLRCVTPSHPAGYVHVSISSNDQNFFGVADQFEYTPVATLGSAMPVSGPVDGGTLVSVFGRNFHERSASLSYLICRFNLTAVPAIYISAREVKCVTPEMPAGVVNLAVSNNIQDYDDAVTMFSYTIVRLMGIEPPEGPVSGGTRIIITGQSFTPGDTYCHLEGAFTQPAQRVTATFVSTVAIACATPPAREEGGAALVYLTNNEARYTSRHVPPPISHYPFDLPSVAFCALSHI